MQTKINLFKNDLYTITHEEAVQRVTSSPLKQIEVDFMLDVISGATYKYLGTKYNLTKDGVYKKKVRCINKLYRFLYYQGKN